MNQRNLFLLYLQYLVVTRMMILTRTQIDYGQGFTIITIMKIALIVFYMTSYFRGILTVTADGKRHVSLGRGYTLYYPEPILEEQRREEYIKKVCELRNNVRHIYNGKLKI